MDKLVNYKTIAYDENGERLLVFDPYKDEIFDIQTGEVIGWVITNQKLKFY